ncbi:acylphosphatase 1, erythrocyte (common) type (predicted), isoform CRA_b [Rattus norvegicus]|uniref:Acylphosphatase 1, erythrocyte (Common) type (Predicted), isoform CRA_b n=1 Tax=Rattus norvegicus TaxID=10116 RepID=A6JE22_RAT|nr:acylphosphatase 1, erythrocyte (common) type (predicted), isoform CRA_b [Rattus norvegicus]
MWKSEDHLREPVLSFYHVDSRDRTQVIWLGGKNHLVGSL